MRACVVGAVLCPTITSPTIPPQRPPGVFSVLDDICFQMHGQSEGADGKLLEVGGQ